jgi:lysozyme
MHATEEGLALIRAEEGLRLHAYPDPASALATATRGKPWGFRPASEIRATLGVGLQLLNGKPWTIGYGFTEIGGRRVMPDDTMTRAEADAQLRSIVQDYERAVLEAVHVPLNEPMFNACLSICWNIGQAAFAGSTLVRLINAHDYVGAAAEFDRWNRAGGEVNAGLAARRDREEALFKEGMRQAEAYYFAHLAGPDEARVA